MVAISDAWTIGQLWIVLALIGFAITAIGGAVYFGPESKRIREAAEAEGPSRPEPRPSSGGSSWCRGSTSSSSS